MGCLCIRHQCLAQLIVTSTGSPGRKHESLCPGDPPAAAFLRKTPCIGPACRVEWPVQHGKVLDYSSCSLRGQPLHCYQYWSWHRSLKWQSTTECGSKQHVGSKDVLAFNSLLASLRDFSQEDVADGEYGAYVTCVSQVVPAWGQDMNISSQIEFVKVHPFVLRRHCFLPQLFHQELGVPRGFPHVCWALSLLTAMTYLNSIPLLSWIPVMNTLAAADAKNSSCASRQKHRSSCFCCHYLPDWDGSCLQEKMSLDLPSVMIPNVKGTDIQPQLQGALLPLLLQLALLLLLSLSQVPLLVPLGLMSGPLGTSKGKQIFQFYFSLIKILPFIDSVMSS